MSKFKLLRKITLRPKQEEAITQISDSNKKYIALEAPTGAGKSILGMVYAEMILNKESGDV
jgi:superfamily II DNA or RNA helicase